MTPGTWRRRHRVVLVSALTLGALAIVLATHRDQARAVWHSVTGVGIAPLAAALLLVLCQVGCQALRLWAILPRSVPLTLGKTAYAFTIGEWCNIFTPARAGDALKVVLMHRASGAASFSLPKATGAVLADKVVDVGSLVLLCTVAGLAGLLRAGAQARMPRPGVVVAVGAGLVLLLLGVRWARPRWPERLTWLRRELGTGLAALKDPAKVLASLAFSLGAWLAELWALSVLCTALGFALSLPSLVLALAALNLGVSVPLAVASLGVYEAVLAFGLSRAGVPLPSAVAIATLHHALQLLGLNLAAGGFALWVTARGSAARVSNEG